MINSQPWAKSSNFEALAIYFDIILKRLCNSYGYILLTKNTLNALKLLEDFQFFKSISKTTSKQPLFDRTGTYDSPCMLRKTFGLVWTTFLKVTK